MLAVLIALIAWWKAHIWLSTDPLPHAWRQPGTPAEKRSDCLPIQMLVSMPICTYANSKTAASKMGEIGKNSSEGPGSSQDLEFGVVANLNDGQTFGSANGVEQPPSECGPAQVEHWSRVTMQHDVSGLEAMFDPGHADRLCCVRSSSSSEQRASTLEELDDWSSSFSICVGAFVEGDDVRLLPCGHDFHPACIDPWLLQRSGTCPLW